MIRFLLIVGMMIFAALGVWQIGKAGLLAAKAWAAPVLIEHAFVQSQTLGKSVKPWSWSDAHPVARLDVPKLNVHRFVLSDANMRNLAFGPSLQTVGLHRVIFAHRDTHFNFLKELQVSDQVSFEFRGEPKETWTIARFDVIDADALYIPDDIPEDLIILVTCYPFDAVSDEADQRFVAWLTRQKHSFEEDVSAT